MESNTDNVDDVLAPVVQQKVGSTRRLARREGVDELQWDGPCYIIGVLGGRDLRWSKIAKHAVHGGKLQQWIDQSLISLA